MSVLSDLMHRRHTVRSYAQTPVEREKLRAVLEAGRWAPTAANAQPQRILVLDTPENLAKVRAFCTFGWQQGCVDFARESDTPDHEHVVLYYGAPVVLVVCYDRDACWHHPESGDASGVTDATIVATHMMLEATAQGLGSTWVSYFDRRKARELLDVPANWEICDMLYLGYPAEGEQGAHAAGSREPLGHTCFFNGGRTGSHEQFPIENR